MNEPASTAETAADWFPHEVDRIAWRLGITRDEVIAAIERLRAAGRVRG